MAKFPAFEPTGATTVRITLSTGLIMEFDVADIKSPLDLVPDVEHPDFEALYAVLRWIRGRGVTLDQVFVSEDLVAAYLAAEWTPMQVPE